MAWSDLIAALALFLVLEGLLPFANPQGYRRALASMLKLEERTLRTIGLFSIIGGLMLLYFVRRGA
jgi:uncharacterized protein YjeT (DUF2065 family)